MRGVIGALPVVLVVTSWMSFTGDDSVQVVEAGDPSSTATACRNSNAPVCGPFRFEPQPGPDSPMSVQVAVEPPKPVAGQEVVFRLTLVDADGVSYGSSTFSFGDSGLSGSPFAPCDRFGSWEPPGRNVTAASEVQEVRHRYAAPGTYTATFSFEAGPFACVDSVTGRGDRPYASSGTGTITVVVT